MAAGSTQLTSRQRMNIALECGKPDRIPIAIVCDSDYVSQAAGADLREFLYGDNLARAQITGAFYERHPHNDFAMVWSGISPGTVASRRLVRCGGRYFHFRF